MASPIRPTDLIEEALSRVWTEAHREFGPDESTWLPGETREYELRLDAVRFDPQVVA